MSADRKPDDGLPPGTREDAWSPPRSLRATRGRIKLSVQWTRQGIMWNRVDS